MHNAYLSIFYILMSMEITSAINKEIRKRRISQVNLSNSIGLSQSQISRICAGKTERISTGLKKICAYFDIDLPSSTKSNDIVAGRVARLIADICDGSTARKKNMVSLLENLAALAGNSDHLDKGASDRSRKKGKILL